MSASICASTANPRSDRRPRSPDRSSRDALSGPGGYRRRLASVHLPEDRMALTLESINLYDPDGYVEAPPHEAFEYLRRTRPVYWQDMPDGTGYWAVLKHADVVEVAREPVLYSAEV